MCTVITGSTIWVHHINRAPPARVGRWPTHRSQVGRGSHVPLQMWIRRTTPPTSRWVHGWRAHHATRPRVVMVLAWGSVIPGTSRWWSMVVPVWRVMVVARWVPKPTWLLFRWVVGIMVGVIFLLPFAFLHLLTLLSLFFRCHLFTFLLLHLLFLLTGHPTPLA